MLKRSVVVHKLMTLAWIPNSIFPPTMSASFVIFGVFPISQKDIKKFRINQNDGKKQLKETSKIQCL